MEKQFIITKKAVWQVLSDYMRQYKKHPIPSMVAVFMPAIGTILVGFVPPLIVARLVNMLIENASLSMLSASGMIILFAGSWLLGEGCWRLGMHFLIKIETAGTNTLSKESFRRLSVRDYDFYTNNFVGSLVKKASSFSRGFEIFTDVLSFNLINNIFPIIFAIIILGRYSYWLPTLLVILALIAALVGVPIVRRRSRLVAERHEASSKMVGRISDALSNILAIKSFAKEQDELNTFGGFVDEYTTKFKKSVDYQNLRFDMVMSPLYVATNTIGLLAALFFTTKLNLPAGTIVIVFSYYAQISRIFWDINKIYRSIETSVSEAAEFTQMLINPPAIQDAENAHELTLSNNDINFKHINFTYGTDQGADLFLNEFNLAIKGNQRVGLVGPSGSGKTTITKLLLRFIDLESGTIEIDNQDISKVTQKSLREALAYVPQESLLFHRSLMENIAYGNENATEAEIMQAAKLARADEFIERLPNKYKTLVGERGIKLSGGQRQRVAIARAILKKAPILILDEATSSLDSESEKYIQQGLWELMKGKTALVIAHRLSTIKHLDRIIVLDHGKIVQDGTHEELIKQKGLYAKLWSHQSGEFLSETEIDQESPVATV